MALAGKVVVVTGASRGIGRAVALHYAKEQAKVIATATNVALLESLKEEAGGRIETLVADLSKVEEVEKVAKHVLGAHPEVHGLVNNAGIYVKGGCEEGDPDEWAKMMRINVDAPMRLTHRLVPAMPQGSAVVNIGSIAAMESMTSCPAYAASKHALWGWSRSAYHTLRHKGIKITCINPAFVATDMASAPGLMKERMIQPEDVATIAMLPFTLSPGCVPEEITLRLTLSPYPQK